MNCFRSILSTDQKQMSDATSDFSAISSRPTGRSPAPPCASAATLPRTRSGEPRAAGIARRARRKESVRLVEGVEERRRSPTGRRAGRSRASVRAASARGGRQTGPPGRAAGAGSGRGARGRATHCSPRTRTDSPRWRPCLRSAGEAAPISCLLGSSWQHGRAGDTGPTLAHRARDGKKCLVMEAVDDLHGSVLVWAIVTNRAWLDS